MSINKMNSSKCYKYGLWNHNPFLWRVFHDIERSTAVRDQNAICVKFRLVCCKIVFTFEGTIVAESTYF